MARRSLGNARQILSDPEFLNPESIRTYTNAGRELLRDVSVDLAIGSEVLRAVLKEIPVIGSNAPGGARVRAFAIARHVDIAAEESKAAAARMAQCYAAFLKHFAPELEQAGHKKPAPKFTFA
ncbi:plasmid transfer protein TraA [Yinghuangia sp. YIM S09857]|uniref:plasmid transfer protein TraA n=1 Tax=Yinghuangia sp. YIM S09857 TaxID=3436929 RepID=UPI003F531FCE